MDAQDGVMALRRPYRPRTVGFRGVEAVAGWTVKLYGISAHAAGPRAAVMEATLRIAASALPSPPRTADRYGVGFVVGHDAPARCFALVHWWSEENEIHQRLFSAPADRPEELEPHPSPAIGCVWELSVTDHERRAWLRHVLANPQGPDLDGYLGDHFEGRI
jgi:hypothetical protein